MTQVPQKRPAFEPASELLKPTGYEPDMARPATTVAGAVLVLLRVIAGFLLGIGLIFGWPSWAESLDLSFDDAVSSAEVRTLALGIILSVLGVFLLLDAVLGFLILRGHNWARIVIMTFSALSITTSFVGWWAQGQEITITGALPSVALDILILLALSSRSAAAYARRHERR